MEANNVREQKDRERRRKKYKFALVKWVWPMSGYFVEHKDVLKWKLHQGTHEVICDWEPERVLRGMLKLLKEKEDEI
jgi:hypothetical protein